MRLFFEDVKFPQTSEVDEIFSEELENSLRKGFQLADLALADDGSVNNSSGTTALAALIFGRYTVLVPILLKQHISLCPRLVNERIKIGLEEYVAILILQH